MRATKDAKAAAHRFLSGVREGAPASPYQIRRALIDTGDVDPAPATGAQLHRPAGSWERSTHRGLASPTWFHPLP